MKISKVALCLFFISSFIALIGVVTNCELLLLFTKPVIIPSVYFYYVSAVRKPSEWFAFFLTFNFIGDTIVMLRLESQLFIMVPYLISYLLILRSVITDAFKCKPNLPSIAYSLVVFAALLFIVALLIDTRDPVGRKLIFPMIIYGTVLSALVAFSVYNYLVNRTISGLYLLIAAGCSLISDSFYILYNLHFHIQMLNYVNAAMQLLSYFFFVKYMVNRENNLLLKLPEYGNSRKYYLKAKK